MSVAERLAERSLCFKATVGAVIVDVTGRVVSTGYNGPPAGFRHNDLSCASWCPRGAEHAEGRHATAEQARVCYAVHAEANALLTGDRSSWQGGVMYCTKHPCWDCAKLIANSGLSRLEVRPLEEPRTEHHERYIWLTTVGMEVHVWET